MKKELLFELRSAHRDNLRVHGYRFGNGEKTLAIVGSLRGDELQQLYIASQITKALSRLEKEGKILDGKEVLIIPSINNYSLNIGKRYWGLDNTDINRMFPGYDKGETTQRIAERLFNTVKDYKYGINLTSFYMDGSFSPHIRTYKTGLEDLESAKSFGFKYIYLREPTPQESATLNYNWQVWGTKAYSVYVGHSEYINIVHSNEVVNAVLRFLKSENVIDEKVDNGYLSEIILDSDIVNVQAEYAGIFVKVKIIGDYVSKNDVLAEIIDPHTGETLSTILSPINGRVLYSHSNAIIFQRKIAFMVV